MREVSAYRYRHVRFRVERREEEAFERNERRAKILDDDEEEDEEKNTFTFVLKSRHLRIIILYVFFYSRGKVQ